MGTSDSTFTKSLYHLFPDVIGSISAIFHGHLKQLLVHDWYIFGNATNNSDYIPIQFRALG